MKSDTRSTGVNLFYAVLLLVLAAPGCSSKASDVDPRSTVDGQKTANPEVLARDGVPLDTYVYLPKGPGPYPTLVVRTIYGLPISPIGGYLRRPGGDVSETDDDDDLDPEEAARIGWPLITESGYALVIQVTRGRHGSGGVDRSWLDDGSDGYDLIEWVAAQPWSDGAIGLFGDSATGASALLAAAAKPPSLDAVYVQVAPGNVMGEDFLPDDGADKLESLMVQGASIAFDVGEEHLAARAVEPAEVESLFEEIGKYLSALFQGLEDPSSSPEWMALPVARMSGLSRLMPFWDAVFSREGQATYRASLNVLGRIEVPVYSVTMWQDVFLKSAVQLHEDLQGRGIPSRLMLLNGSHYDIDDPSIWPKRVMLDWFDHFLRGVQNGIASGPAVEFQVQGDGDALRSSEVWPPPASMVKSYLSSQGTLIPNAPESGAAAREFIYDPATPVPTLGGLNLLAPAGIQDHAQLLDRADVLSWVGQPLEADGYVVGRITANLHVATDQVDTDFMMKLLDIAPDGAAYAIAEDQIRLRHRSGRAMSSLVEPAEVVSISMDLGPSAYVLRAGHRIGVMITSSDFPAWDRNTNTGLPSWASEEVRVAVNSVFSDGPRASWISIPWSAQVR